MRRMMHRLAVLGVVSATGLALSAAAVAHTVEPRTSGSECVVEHVDERGAVTDTFAEREGAEYGQFRCEGGQWVFAWAPFERDDAITAGEIQVDPAGTISVRRFVGPAQGYELTMAEMAGIIQAVTGDRDVVIDRAVVTVDDGRERSPEEIEAILAGKDTDARVLGVIDRPDLALSTKDVIGETGGTPETTVVYFSIWGAIKGAFAWVVNKIEEVGEWIEEHCFWGPSSDGLGVSLTCRW